ncbi:MAG TPA: glycine zipper family protein [Candidatus Tectomicrobia bacterium]|nr:glycine zipper family protein [Candidatus Tectomicrobia bacterium]
MSKKWWISLPMLVCISACTTLPAGPNVMVLPGVGKPFDQFQVDDVVCRQYAQGQLGIPPGEATTQSTVQGAAIGTILGAAAGAAIGAAAGSPEIGAAVGAGTGVLVGTTAGAEAGYARAGTLQWRYDVAYVQCMYAKGNQVPGTAPSSSYVPPPPGTPPPPGLPPPPLSQGPPRR